MALDQVLLEMLDTSKMGTKRGKSTTDFFTFKNSIQERSWQML
jgi:hypothetical protein